jgi:hypothetical protein
MTNCLWLEGFRITTAVEKWDQRIDQDVESDIIISNTPSHFLRINFSCPSFSYGS